MGKKARKSTVKQVVMTSTMATGLALASPTIVDAALGDQMLHSGMSHPDVVDLQDLLSEKGFFTYERSTGFFGTVTLDAVKDFQRANNLTADGIVGPKTFAALGQAAAKKPADVAPPKKEETKPKAPAQTSQPANAGSIPSGIYRIGSTGSVVTELQSQLRSVGVFNQAPTGYYGTVTQASVRQFQQSKGLQVDGIVGPQTIQALASAVKGEKPKAPTAPENNNQTEPAQPSNPVTSGIYRVGSSGDAVHALQSQLRSVGVFNQNPTGYYGKDTEASVRSFQRTHGLTADGIAGPKTLSKLKEVATNQDGKQQTGGSGGNSGGSGGNSGGAVENSPAALVTNMLAEASIHIGTPYVWGGTTPSGFDCSGFVQYVFAQQGISIPRTVATQWNAATAVSQPSVGDIVFFETYTNGPSHNGIYIGNNQFIHSGSSTGVTITSMDNSYWKARYLGAKRLH